MTGWGSQTRLVIAPHLLMTTSLSSLRADQKPISWSTPPFLWFQHYNRPFFPDRRPATMGGSDRSIEAVQDGFSCPLLQPLTSEGWKLHPRIMLTLPFSERAPHEGAWSSTVHAFVSSLINTHDSSYSLLNMHIRPPCSASIPVPYTTPSKHMLLASSWRLWFPTCQNGHLQAATLYNK